jgi:hypothetical protein
MQDSPAVPDSKKSNRMKPGFDSAILARVVRRLVELAPRSNIWNDTFENIE